MINPDKIKKAILEEDCSGWLFFNFRHRDLLSDLILGIDSTKLNSRGWFYLIFPDRENIKITHNVEPDALDQLPGEKIIYTSRDELKVILGRFKDMLFAVQEDINLTQISFLDSGTASLLKNCGIRIKSSAPLVQKTIGVLDSRQIASHEKAGKALYEIITESWDLITSCIRKNRAVTEKEVQAFILDRYRENNLLTEHLPLVAFAGNTADPHYDTGTRDTVLEKNMPVQFDIWGRLDVPGSVYADISWAGFTAPSCPAPLAKSFAAVMEARDAVTNFISRQLDKNVPVSGAEADLIARSVLDGSGYGYAVKHRTGHAIDLELHGYGGNLDSVEFPDNRPLIGGSCFSVEPGLYFKDFGIRTEINCYIINNSLVISGGSPQKDILLLK